MSMPIQPNDLQSRRPDLIIDDIKKHYLFRADTVKESDDDARDKRLLKDFHLYPEKRTDTPVYAIPYNWIGKNLAGMVSNTPNGMGDVRNYQDWYMTTPAYNIKYSGYTNGELFKRLFYTNHQNNIKNRISRWVEEPIMVTFCDSFDKIASIVAILLLLITAVIALFQIISKTTTVYLKKDGTVNKPYTLLNKIWVWIKLVLSGCSAAIITYNIYKRTTIPRVGVQIKSFKTPKIFSRAKENVIQMDWHNPDRTKSYLAIPPNADGELQYIFDEHPEGLLDKLKSKKNQVMETVKHRFSHDKITPIVPSAQYPSNSNSNSNSIELNSSSQEHEGHFMGDRFESIKLDADAVQDLSKVQTFTSFDGQTSSFR